VGIAGLDVRILKCEAVGPIQDKIVRDSPLGTKILDHCPHGIPSDIFGLLKSAVVNRPLVFLTLIIDFDETLIPLNLIIMQSGVEMDKQPLLYA
jgi:hypothetical protein